jgi:hypothetical protein
VKAGPSFWLAGTDVRAHSGDEIRLKDLVNLQMPEVPIDAQRVLARFTSRENRKLARLQWVTVEGAVPVDLLELDGGHRRGYGEGALRAAAPREVYQFERVGFVRIEADWVPGSDPLRACFGHP